MSNAVRKSRDWVQGYNAGIAKGEEAPEIRLNDDGTLDEIVAANAGFHLEQMDDDLWWMSIQSGGRLVNVWLRREKRKIVATYEETRE